MLTESPFFGYPNCLHFAHVVCWSTHCGHQGRQGGEDQGGGSHRMYYYSKDASCCSGVCVHCKLFHLSISPSAAPSTRPTGSSSMGFWGSLLASDKTLQIKKNTLKRAICAFKVLSEEFFASHLEILLNLHKHFEIIQTNCFICCDDGLILDPRSTFFAP